MIVGIWKCILQRAGNAGVLLKEIYEIIKRIGKCTIMLGGEAGIGNCTLYHIMWGNAKIGKCTISDIMSCVVMQK